MAEGNFHQDKEIYIPESKKAYRYILIGIIVIFLIVFLYILTIPPKDVGRLSYKEIIYEIEGREVKIENNVRYFGNEAAGDFNADGLEDVAFLITDNPGGSGTFYYVVAAILQTDGYHGTNAMLLGDRIAPQTTEFRNGEIIVNYADRKLGEPMTTRPSVGVSKYFKITNNRLVEIKK